MMMIYSEVNQRIEGYPWQSGQPIADAALWIDLLCPAPEEEAAAEAFLGLDIPTRDEMREIEVSNRLYEESGALFFTATMLTKVDSDAPETHAVTFIVTGKRLVTVRYVEMTSFRRFAVQCIKTGAQAGGGAALLLLMLLQAIVNRQADILERVDHEIDRIGKEIFQSGSRGKHKIHRDYQRVLERIGRCGGLTAKIHESLVTFERILTFAAHQPVFSTPQNVAELASLRGDIVGLSDHDTYLSGRVNFLLDATLGMISIQQNGVFRVLSIASLVFLPPTLVAGIYGMNFALLPELNWHYGYPMALVMMLFSAILPYAYLRKRKYL